MNQYSEVVFLAIPDSDFIDCIEFLRIIDLPLNLGFEAYEDLVQAMLLGSLISPGFHFVSCLQNGFQILEFVEIFQNHSVLVVVFGDECFILHVVFGNVVSFQRYESLSHR